MKLEKARELAEFWIEYYTAAGFMVEPTGYLRLGLQEFKSPYLLVSPPDRRKLLRGAEQAQGSPHLVVKDDAYLVTLVLAPESHRGAYNLIYTGPWGYILYLSKRAHNMGYHFLLKGERPGIYHRQTLIAALTEEQILNTLGIEEEKRDFGFRRRFYGNWWYNRRPGSA